MTVSGTLAGIAAARRPRWTPPRQNTDSPLLSRHGAALGPGRLDVREVMLVTGASRGIGAATAVLAAERGYDVAIGYRRTPEQPNPSPGRYGAPAPAR